MKQALYLLMVMSLLMLGSVRVHSQEKETLIVFAASSLTDTFETIAGAFEVAHPGVEVLFNFSASSTLATQLNQGAPADVFASANLKQMQVAIDGGRIESPAQEFAQNRLVVIVPVEHATGIESLADLARPNVQLILAAPEVPIRSYTDAMLEKMALDPQYGADYRAAVLANVVSEEPNVRQVAAKVALGEADAGVVYLSDVTPDMVDAVMMIPIPDAFNTLAVYPIGIIKDSAQAELAQDFVDFVLSEQGQAILAEWGFIPIKALAEHELVIEGLVAQPLRLTVDLLRADYEAHTISVSYLEDEASISSSFTGVLVWDLISAAGPLFDPTITLDLVRKFIVVTGEDGQEAVLAWGEIDPELTHQAILIAYEEAGQPMETLRLIVPSDQRDWRYIRGPVSIRLQGVPVSDE